jgi:hypothetical protein
MSRFGYEKLPNYSKYVNSKIRDSKNQFLLRGCFVGNVGDTPIGVY